MALRRDSLQGRWTRSLLAWPDGRRDVSSVVTWLQGPTRYADLRQPHAATMLVPSLRALTLEQVVTLADQEGFAGGLHHHADASFEWRRHIDFQPRSGHVDRGFLDDVGSMVIETGYAKPYTEHWHRADRETIPCGALDLQEIGSGRHAVIVRVGRSSHDPERWPPARPRRPRHIPRSCTRSRRLRDLARRHHRRRLAHRAIDVAPSRRGSAGPADRSR